MGKSRPSRSRKSTGGLTDSLMVRLDAESKACLTRAAELRHVSVSDYIRIVTVAQARREVEAAGEQTIRLSPGEQIAFWNALHQTPELTSAQRELAAVMRGDA